jgi:deoxyadenosine/deoxycytidine kinase
MRIVIDGNIGCGKSTLIQSLTELYKDKSINILEENVDEWKPYLTEFYKDMESNSLKFQMKVLEHHLHSGKITGESSNLISIHERSPLSCIEIFGKDLLASGFLKEIDIDLMKSYNAKLGWTPDIIIYLKSDTNIASNRCIERSREGEDTIPISYLNNISELYNELYEKNTSNQNGYIVYTINANNEKAVVLKEVDEIISRLF